MKRVTMQDVAREVGVTRTAVSLAFRGTGGVGSETRERILETAKRLGYRRDIVASQLASLRANTIGFALLDLRFEINTEIYRGLREQLESASQRIVVTIGDPGTSRDRQSIDDLLDVRVDAVVLSGSLLTDTALQAYARQVPLVVVTRAVPGVDSVVVDDALGARLAVTHLIALGHHRIAHLSMPAWYSYRARTQGYEEVMGEAGLEPCTVHAGFDQEDAETVTSQLLDDHPDVTAIFCHNDVAALGAMDAVRAHGLHVPEDVSIIGFDDTPAAALTGVQLTSVTQHARELGRLAGEQVLHRVSNPDGEPQRRTLEPTLIIRASTTAPRKTGLVGVSRQPNGSASAAS